MDSSSRMVYARTGPFTPPIVPGPSGTVVTSAARTSLEHSVLGDQVVFRDIILDKAVWLDWQKWDPKAPVAIRPAEGPGGYIWEGEHSVDAARALGTLWELIPNAAISHEALRAELTQGTEFEWAIARSRGNHLLVTDVGRQVLGQIGGAWLKFLEVQADAE